MAGSNNPFFKIFEGEAARARDVSLWEDQVCRHGQPGDEGVRGGETCRQRGTRPAVEGLRWRQEVHQTGVCVGAWWSPMSKSGVTFLC